MAKTTRPTKRKAVIWQQRTILGGYWYYMIVGDNGKQLTKSFPLHSRRSCVDVCRKYFPDFKIVFE